MKSPVTGDGPRTSTVDDGYLLALEFAGGGRATAVSSGATMTPSPRRAELHGSEGQLVIQGQSLSLVARDGRTEAIEVESLPPWSSAPHVPLLRRWTMQMTEAVTSGRRLPCDFAQGLPVQEVVDAALKSSEGGGVRIAIR